MMLCLGLVACGKAKVESEQMMQAPDTLPRPDVVLVYDFAFAPDQVTLDKGILPRIGELIDSSSRSDQELAIGKEVASALATQLVEDINGMGLSAKRASGLPPFGGTTLVVRGQLLSIDEGNRTERTIIGLGAGRTDVEAAVQVFQLTYGEPQEVEQLKVESESGDKPGAAEMGGVGALTGRLATSLAISAGTSAADEAWHANVDADAKRLADKVAEQLRHFFAEQGWVAAAS
ncbi:MAG: DUF4410 domain-containing protein [Alphaproteobacteria bacterium]|nr:DUF4410 domain-containing protein [Alphaproteobacteria bacterium]